MRTVEQIANDLKKAKEAEAVAHAVTEKFRNELLEIYRVAKDALGILEVWPR